MDADKESDLKRFDTPIVLLALALYVVERVLAFVWLQNRIGSGAGWEARFQEFFFGQEAHSIFNILLGLDMPESLLGILDPRNIFRAVLQTLHFLANWWIAGLLFRLSLFLAKRRAEQE
ncbi:MAG: hypothetical protein JW748_13185 [Anaerolineales bacterium]|nr:hypothetical protein [Anaerolineales bacterium]